MDSYKITFDAFDKQAEAYQQKFMDLDIYDDTYKRFCSLVKKTGATILEIGCGPGNITKYMSSKRPDFKILAIDVAPNMIRLAKQNNPAVDFSVMDCRQIDQIAQNFDGIICGFCMPYLSKEDCAKLVKDCWLLLNPGGVIYFSTIEGDYNNSGFETSSNRQDKAYVYYHQEDYLQKELEKNHIHIIEMKRKDFPKADGTSSTHLIFIAGK